MSRNGSGTYTLPTGNPVVTNTVISSTWANTTLTDLANAMTGSVAADGQTPMTGPLNLNSNKIANVTDPTLDQDAATKAYVDAADAILTAAIAAVSSVPTATINMWPTASAPSGYLACDGTAVSRSTYAALFAIIGTTFGVGDGTTTFNVPNYTNRMPYGATVGTTGGSADAVVVSHTHTASVTDPSHTHTVNKFAGVNASAGTAYVGDSGGGGVVGTVSTNSSTTGISVSNSTTGVSGTNANLPPYLGINFIIKV